MTAPARQLPAAVDETARGRLQELAYQQGRRDADVDARLLAHERHLLRTDQTLEKFGEWTEKLDGRLDDLIAAQGTQAAVEADREKRAHHGFTRLQVVGGAVIAIAVPIISAFIAAGKLF